MNKSPRPALMPSLMPQSASDVHRSGKKDRLEADGGCLGNLGVVGSTFAALQGDAELAALAKTGPITG